MMTSPAFLRQPIRTLVALLAGVATFASAQPSMPSQSASLQLAGASIRLEYPEEWRDWAISLAGYADSAADEISAMLGVAVPAGTIRWEPAASGPGSGADGVVEVTRGGGGTLVRLRTNIPLMVQDYGAAYALGYGRWVGAYAVARVALGAPGNSAPWWTEGAALYLTDRLFRDARSTTPVLYGIESNYIRAAQIRRPVDLAADRLTDAGRGKAYVTFRLLESLYGQEAVTRAIARLVERPSADLAVIVDALGTGLEPDPDALLRDWLDPTAAIDVQLDRVDVRDDGSRVEIRIGRSSPVPVPVEVEVRTVDGQVVTERVPAGTDEARVQIEVETAPTAVVLDPAGLVPDVNRANNRQGFGDAANVERFFTFDDSFGLGELEFDGEVTLDEAEQRGEEFRLRITNRSDRRTGLGFLVSAQWSGRPDRVQRAFWVPLGPGETRIVSERLAYPNRGTGRARVEARFWPAGSVEELTDKLVTTDPGSTSNYIVVRDAPDAPRRPARDLFRVPPQIAETAGEAAPVPADPAAPAASGNGGDPATAPPDDGFGVEIRSPDAQDVPIGDVTLAATVTGPDLADRVDFFVNDRRIGTVTEPPYRLDWTYPEEESVFVIRTVAVAGDRIASDERVLDRASIAFGATVDLVTLHVTVRDAAGRLVRGLVADDFEVIEDGARQEIVQFDFGEVPVSAALLLDQSSSMIGGGIRAERAGAERLVESLVSDVNRVMVMGFNDRVYVYSGFTTDRERLQAALAVVDPDGSTALFDTLAEAVRKVNRDRGKRALVVLSDGLDTNSDFAFEDVVEFLRQSDVLVYTIGLQLMHDGTELGDASGAVRRGVEQLRTLAEATGGAAYFPLALEELEEIYGRIADELNSQYALSFYPQNRAYDGRFRQLSVRIPEHPEYWVQAREGYYAAGPEGR